MEVASAEEAHAVLLEGMEGTQYITIQRADEDSLSKGVPLFTLNGTELISEGMVVDMINGVSSDYNTATQYYETDDLLPHELTEEDRRLAAALVAVQLQQQQKQQQLHSNAQQDNSLADVTELTQLPAVAPYTIQTIQETNAPTVYSAIQTSKRNVQTVKHEFVNVKCEDADYSAESSEDDIPAPAGSKRSLPHKKRIPQKLKQHSKKTSSKRDKEQSNIEQDESQLFPKLQITTFKCEICSNKFSGQLNFFEHLKTHYEPVKGEQILSQGLNVNGNNNLPSISVNGSASIQTIQHATIEEFSEPEDFMEGIRGVVEETGAQIDDSDDDVDPIPENGNESSLWTVSEVSEQVESEENAVNTSDNLDQNQDVTEEDIETENLSIQTTNKRKKKGDLKTTEDLICPHCDRKFHHKNSLAYHMRSHSGERPHQCEVCGKGFFASSALKVHKRLHSGDKPYKCDECGRHFRQWGDLKYHTTSLHSEQKQFQCEYCGKDFARKYSLIVHRRIHTGEKNYHCEYCNKTFRASSYLQNHRRIHTGEKPHPCSICGKPFRVRSDMKRHMLTHSRVKSEKTNKVTPTKIEERSDENNEDKKNIKQLKLKVETAVSSVENTDELETDDNAESILPHAAGQTLAVRGENVNTFYYIQ